MRYFQARSDLQTMEFFKEAVKAFWESKAGYDGARRTSYRAVTLDDDEIPAEIVADYQACREIVARSLPKATRIAQRLGVPIVVKSFPAPAVGGAIFNICIFEAILLDASDRGVGQEMILDAINKTLGQCEDKVDSELFRLLNPFNWLYSVLVAILRIPFMTLKATGFDVSKVEEHMFGKLFKVAEVGGIILVVCFVLGRLGYGPEQVIKVLSDVAKLK